MFTDYTLCCYIIFFIHISSFCGIYVKYSGCVCWFTMYLGGFYLWQRLLFERACCCIQSVQVEHRKYVLRTYSLGRTDWLKQQTFLGISMKDTYFNVDVGGPKCKIAWAWMCCFYAVLPLSRLLQPLELMSLNTNRNTETILHCLISIYTTDFLTLN